MDGKVPKVAHNLKKKWRSTDVKIDENTDFKSLLLSKSVLKGLKFAGFKKPSPVQLKAIPLGRCGFDLIVQAKSGTGKTCVFAVIALESLADIPNLQVLILSPTREIAYQSCSVINAIGDAFPDLECHTFIGGIPVNQDVENLRSCQIAVGTPGRVKHLIQKNHMLTGCVRLFVLDEADSLIEATMAPDIIWIYNHLPPQKQVLALSATYPHELIEKLQDFMRSPTFVQVTGKELVLEGMIQFYRLIEDHAMSNIVLSRKKKALREILNKVAFSQCLVFSNYIMRVEQLCDWLNEEGFPSTKISSSADQESRLETIDKLKLFQFRILVTSDLTARGIDAANVDLVINLDLPRSLELYLHRIGRAGRFGSKACCITFVCTDYEEQKFTAYEEAGNFQTYPLPDSIPENLLLWTLAQAKASAKHTTNHKKRAEYFESAHLVVDAFDDDGAESSSSQLSHSSSSESIPNEISGNQDTPVVEKNGSNSDIENETSTPSSTQYEAKKDNCLQPIHELYSMSEASTKQTDEQEVSDLPSDERSLLNFSSPSSCNATCGTIVDCDQVDNFSSFVDIESCNNDDDVQDIDNIGESTFNEVYDISFTKENVQNCDESIEDFKRKEINIMLMKNQLIHEENIDDSNDKNIEDGNIVDLETENNVDLETKDIVNLKTEGIVDLKTEDIVDLETEDIVDLKTEDIEVLTAEDIEDIKKLFMPHLKVPINSCETDMLAAGSLLTASFKQVETTFSKDSKTYSQFVNDFKQNYIGGEVPSTTVGDDFSVDELKIMRSVIHKNEYDFYSRMFSEIVGGTDNKISESEVHENEKDPVGDVKENCSAKTNLEGSDGITEISESEILNPNSNSGCRVVSHIDETKPKEGNINKLILGREMEDDTNNIEKHVKSFHNKVHVEMKDTYISGGSSPELKKMASPVEKVMVRNMLLQNKFSPINQRDGQNNMKATQRQASFEREKIKQYAGKFDCTEDRVQQERRLIEDFGMKSPKYLQAHNRKSLRIAESHTQSYSRSIEECGKKSAQRNEVWNKSSKHRENNRRYSRPNAYSRTMERNDRTSMKQSDKRKYSKQGENDNRRYLRQKDREPVRQVDEHSRKHSQLIRENGKRPSRQLMEFGDGLPKHTESCNMTSLSEIKNIRGYSRPVEEYDRRSFKPRDSHHQVVCDCERYTTSGDIRGDSHNSPCCHKHDSCHIKSLLVPFQWPTCHDYWKCSSMPQCCFLRALECSNHCVNASAPICTHGWGPFPCQDYENVHYRGRILHEKLFQK